MTTSPYCVKLNLVPLILHTHLILARLCAIIIHEVRGHMVIETEGTRGKLLREWLAETEAALTKLNRKLEPMLSEKDALEGKIQAFRTLLATEGSIERREEPRRRAVSVADCAYQALKELGQPTHYIKLLQHLNDQGVEVPGASPKNNLVAHMTRDPRIVRTLQRGVYGLSEWEQVGGTAGQNDPSNADELGGEGKCDMDYDPFAEE